MGGKNHFVHESSHVDENIEISKGKNLAYFPYPERGKNRQTLFNR